MIGMAKSNLFYIFCNRIYRNNVQLKMWRERERTTTGFHSCRLLIIVGLCGLVAEPRYMVEVLEWNEQDDSWTILLFAGLHDHDEVSLVIFLVQHHLVGMCCEPTSSDPQNVPKWWVGVDVANPQGYDDNIAEWYQQVKNSHCWDHHILCRWRMNCHNMRDAGSHVIVSLEAPVSSWTDGFETFYTLPTVR